MTTPEIEEIMQDLKNEVYILTKVEGGLYKAIQGDALLEKFRTKLTTIQQKHQEDIEKAVERGRLSVMRKDEPCTNCGGDGVRLYNKAGGDEDATERPVQDVPWVQRRDTARVSALESEDR